MKNFLPLFILLSLSACAPLTPEKFTEDKALFDHALKLYNDKDYSESIPFFESLRNRFPQSPYAIDSELKVADARFETRAWAEAEVDYLSFRSLHPTNAAIPHVVFRIGMCHYKQIPRGIDRDQAHTERALELFLELLNRWPDAPEVGEARPLVAKCKRSLDAREMYVVNFYLRHKKYSAALLRLRDLKARSDFDDVRTEAAYKLGYAYFKLDDKPNAKEALQAVAQNPAAGKYVDKAKSLLSKM